MFNHEIEFINDRPSLDRIIGRINGADALALDIETVNWWDRKAERISLIQLGFREGEQLRVVIIDALSGFGLDPLRQALELSSKMKAIHNASFDAVKLVRHYRIVTSPIHDTMLAARRNGDKKCSLQAQVEMHLGLHLDKTEQRSDWNRRPLTNEQLNYAALDATCTLLLYEQQIARGLRGDYELRDRLEQTLADQSQGSLPLAEADTSIGGSRPGSMIISSELTPYGLALLGIITELNGRYSPAQLAVSVGNERTGLAGWIIDRVLGFDSDLDESSAMQEITALSEGGLIHVTSSRRLEATASGTQLWQRTKPSL